MMEYEVFGITNLERTVSRHIAGVETDTGIFTGCGPTETDALIQAMEKAAAESNEARAELGVLLGQRGDGKGGRPVGS